MHTLASFDSGVSKTTSQIHRSWTRCVDLDPALLADPNPLSRADLEQRRDAMHNLLKCAESSLRALDTMASSIQGVVLLADATGLIVHERGSRSFQDKAHRVALQPGVSWAESQRGTNAIGTALYDAKAVRVQGSEHFLARNNILSCNAAPIFSPVGDILGILDLSGVVDALPGYTLALVQQMARGIADQILHEMPFRRLDFRVGAGPLTEWGQAILLIDEDNRIVGSNETALAALAADWNLIGTPLRQWLDGPLRVEDASLHGHDGSVFTARLHGLPAAAQAASRPGVRPAIRSPMDGLPEPDATTAPLLEQAVRALDTGLAVLLQGETGTGKEVMARHIHARSGWHAGDFVAINCAAMPEHLIESELFGYGPGAFTGARKEGSRGLLRQAHQGVLFLDEIGDMPLVLQTRLLRVLQEREVRPLGMERRVPVEFGLISASHRDLKALVAEGSFRADLYYRLQDMPVQLPALRDRPHLGAFIVDAYRALGGNLHPAAAAALARQPWPGNYRELRSMLLRLRCGHPGAAAITVEQLPPELVRDPRQAPPEEGRFVRQPPTEPVGQQTLQSLEREAINEALADCGGNVSLAARRLGMHRSTLYRKLAS